MNSTLIGTSSKGLSDYSSLLTGTKRTASLRTTGEQSMINNFYKNQKKMSVGNNSRNAVSWVCGPKHEIREIRMPGYTGYIPSVHAENVFSKSYARCVVKSLNGKIYKVHDLTP